MSVSATAVHAEFLRKHHEGIIVLVTVVAADAAAAPINPV